MSSFYTPHTPLCHRSSRSTPAAASSPFAAPGEPTGVSIGPTVQEEPEGSKDPEPATAVHMRTSNSQENARPRPSSRLTSYTTLTNRHSADIDPSTPLNNSAPKSQKSTRFRDEWEADLSVDPREFSNYERYWRGETPDRYTTRRRSRPPPPILNRRYVMNAHDSDEEVCEERCSYSRDPLDAPRIHRMMDEEMGYQSQPFLRRDMSYQPWGANGTPLDWNNLSKREKAEVMRLPLTEWMNSSFKNHFVASLGELVGTTMFLFFAFAGTEVANIKSESQGSNSTTGESTGFDLASLIYISLSFGFSLMVNVWVFFRISGGLFNPAVTLGMIMVKAISVVRGICLLISQMTGAIIASAIVRYLFPESFNVRTTLGGGASLAQGVFIEGILTAELVFTIFMLAKEKHRATFIAPVGIGMALFIAELVGVQFTGGSLNPARSFGPCVITGKFDEEHWIYWVGPFVGSIIAVLFYRFIKTLEYEMANPGADGDDIHPPKILEKHVETPYAKIAPSVAPSIHS